MENVLTIKESILLVELLNKAKNTIKTEEAVIGETIRAVKKYGSDTSTLINHALAASE